MIISQVLDARIASLARYGLTPKCIYLGKEYYQDLKLAAKEPEIQLSCALSKSKLSLHMYYRSIPVIVIDEDPKHLEILPCLK